MTDYKLTQKSIVDELAQFIRQVDGNHKMGAGSLADKICERFRVDAPAAQGEPVAWLAGEVCGGDASHNTVNVALDNPAPWSALPIGAKVAIQSPQPAEQQPAPRPARLVEALEAALMVMTSKEVRLEKKADAITMVRSQLAAHRKQGGVS